MRSDGRPIFPPSELANRWLLPLAKAGGAGIEIGGSAHNDFQIPNTINVDYTDSLDTIYKQDEIRLCGRAMKVDVVAFGDNLPAKDSSFDFLINSHVFEHQPNPLGCLLEWCRVVRSGGIIFSVVPHRNALEADAALPLTTIAHQVRDFIRDETTETHPVEDGSGKFGHYHRYSHESYIELISFFNEVFGPTKLEIVESLKVDDRVGNGYSFVQRIEK